MENLFIFAEQQLVLIIGFVVLVFLFLRHESSKGGEKLSCQQVVRAVNSGDGILLDVRDSKEYDAGHLVDSIHIPHAKVADSIKKIEKYQDKQIIVVDKMGQHSSAVVKQLAEKGFTVARLGGGISEWQQDGLPLVKS